MLAAVVVILGAQHDLQSPGLKKVLRDPKLRRGLAALRRGTVV
jgi:hypothetical protein